MERTTVHEAILRLQADQSETATAAIRMLSAELERRIHVERTVLMTRCRQCGDWIVALSRRGRHRKYCARPACQQCARR